MFEKKSLATRRPQQPFDLLRQMTSELDRMFDEPWTLRWPSAEPASADAPVWAPKIDVVTAGGAFVTRVDLPGMTKEDVLVEVRDGYLTLSGQRRQETRNEQDYVYREEREYGTFSFSVPLPTGANADDVKASFTNGVLEVTVPLPAAAAANGRKIPILDAAAPAKSAA